MVPAGQHGAGFSYRNSYEQGDTMELKTIIIGSLFGLLFSIAIVAGCGKKPLPAPEKPRRSIVFFGDSVTYGYGVDNEKESYYARISKVLRSGLFGEVTTINAGVSGDGSSEGLRRVTTDVTAHNPDIVIIAFGLNDCQDRSMTAEKFHSNITNMIAAMPSRTLIVLATSNSFLETGQSTWEDLNDSLDPFMDEIRSIARERELSLIDVNQIWKDQLKRDSRHMESFYIDPTHPSAKGHGVIYEAYMNVLRRILMKK